MVPGDEWLKRKKRGGEKERERGGGHGPPFKRELSKRAQEVLLVVSAKDMLSTVRTPRAGQYRCLNTNTCLS